MLIFVECKVKRKMMCTRLSLGHCSGKNGRKTSVKNIRNESVRHFFYVRSKNTKYRMKNTLKQQEFQEWILRWILTLYGYGYVDMVQEAQARKQLTYCNCYLLRKTIVFIEIIYSGVCKMCSGFWYELLSNQHSRAAGGNNYEANW